MKKVMYLFLVLLISSILISCKNSITGPEEVESVSRHVTIKVRYNRDIKKVVNPNSKCALVVAYRIYDLNAADNLLEGEWVSPGSYRSGSIAATEIQENVFEAFVQKVPIQGRSSSMSHFVSIDDNQLNDGTSMSSVTAEGITITLESMEAEIVEQKIMNYELLFKIEEVKSANGVG